MMPNRDDDRAVVSEQNVTATVKWFNPVKGFGFVQLGDGSPDVFLHVSALRDVGLTSVVEGATLVCDIGESQRGRQVAAITSVEEPPDAPAGSVPQGRPSGASGAVDVVEGQVKFFNAQKGFGFVVPDDGGPDVFVSARVLERQGIAALEPSQRVRLETRVGHKGPTAESVEIL